jgi:hypothetical protein
VYDNIKLFFSPFAFSQRGIQRMKPALPSFLFGRNKLP